MKYIEVPGSGSFVAEILYEDNENYYVSSYSMHLNWKIPKDAVVSWDTNRPVPQWYDRTPDYQIAYGKHHLVRLGNFGNYDK